MTNVFKSLSTVLIMLISFNAVAQMVIDNNQTPQQLVQDVLLGQGVVVTNIQFTGNQSQIGFFDASNATFPISEGIVMASGNVVDIPAPGGTFASTIVGVPGDADLDVVSSAGTNDAVVLSFDFVPTGDSVQFDYIFGSEEYPEFVNAGFNDVFAFIISGPGFNGPFANGGENIALLPGTTTPVTIDNVNDVVNNQYYVDNQAGGTNGIVYDGYTVALTALAQVECGETYTLKIAVADAGDSSFDSGVFLEARSFNSNAVEVNITTASGAPEDGGGWIVENCTPAEIVFERPFSSADTAIAVPVVIGGSAINGVDYVGVPDTVFFEVGDTTVSFIIEALDDNLVELNDSIILTVFSVNLCGDSIESVGVIEIRDSGDYEYDLVASQNQIVECPGDSVLLTVEGALGNPEYTYFWSNGLIGDSIWITPESDSLLFVNSEDECGAISNEDSVFIQFNANPLPEVNISGQSTFDCTGENITLSASGSNGLPPYAYVWSNSSVGPSTNVTLNSDTLFIVTIQDGCGNFSEPDTINISQNPVPLPDIQTSPDVILDCPGDQATLTAIPIGGSPPYQYSWSNGLGSATTITVQPSETTEYIMSVSDNCYIGTVQDTITVTVIPYVEPSLSVTDTSTICPGDMVTLESVLTDGNDPFQYSWSNGSSETSISESPADSTEYILIVTDDCGNSVQDTATVDVPVYDDLVVTLLNEDLLEGDTVIICELWVDTITSQVSGGLSPYSYSWSGTLIDGMFMINDSAILTVPYELPSDSSVFEVYALQITDQCAEESVAEVPVQVISCDIVTPNVFSPESVFESTTDFCGNTPQNNVFNLPCLNLYPGNSLTIWDRWGRKVYESEEYHLNPWDGGNQSSGTYYYICELPRDLEPITGYFQLVR